MDFKPLSNLLGLTLSSARGNAKERVNIGSVAMRCLRLVKNKICSADSMTAQKSSLPRSNGDGLFLHSAATAVRISCRYSSFKYRWQKASVFAVMLANLLCMESGMRSDFSIQNCANYGEYRQANCGHLNLACDNAKNVR